MPERRRMRLNPTRLIKYWTNRRFAAAAKRIAPIFDEEFYLKSYPDVRDSGFAPAMHWAIHGWKEGRDPSPTFSTSSYLAAFPNLVKGTEDPLSHFLKTGKNPAKSDHKAAADEVAAISSEFDVDYYVERYRDFADSGLAPVEHYCDKGWRLGYNPSRTFSTSNYLAMNPDVRDSGVNPFWHYLVAGRDEGRSPKHQGGWQLATLAQLQSLEKTRQSWLKSTSPPDVISVENLAKQLSDQRIGRQTIISIGHDDYRTTTGGVQLCIDLEARQANERSIDYVNLHPWQPLPVLAEENSDPIVRVVYNNKLLGHARTSQVSKALNLSGSFTKRLVVHHLSGHSVEAIAALARCLAITDCSFWLHDHFSICTSFALQRNDVASCQAPEHTSNACSMCIYGSERKRQFTRFQSFFQEFDIHLLSPSEFTLAFWSARSNLAATSGKVVPHMTLAATKRPAIQNVESDRPCRIAFVGHPSPHKGWPIFENLLEQFGTDDRYEFFQFSTTRLDQDSLCFVPIHAHASDPTSSLDKLKDHNIDIVVHWANCMETFSFTTFEAIAAGAFVVTNTRSGNVAAAVRSHAAGAVLSSQEDLFDLASGAGLVELAEKSRVRRANYDTEVTFSAFSLENSEQGACAA